MLEIVGNIYYVIQNILCYTLVLQCCEKVIFFIVGIGWN